MRVPTALDRWAGEHQHQLSDETVAEVATIAVSLRQSTLADRHIADVTKTDLDQLDSALGSVRAERARLLIGVVAKWHAELPGVTATESTAVTSEPAAPAGEAIQSPSDPLLVSRLRQNAGAHNNPAATAEPSVTAAPTGTTTADIAAPAFLRSDKVDEDDSARMHGPDSRPWMWILSVLGLILVAALAIGAFFFVQKTKEDAESVDTTEIPSVEPTIDAVEQAPSAEPSAQSSPVPQAGGAGTADEPVEDAPTVVPEPVGPRFWADTSTILNAGTTEIVSSTYAVSPANRAVLLGHTGALTGVIIADDGRVLTSGADRRLVDWGADVTLAQPDVLNVAAPVTALTRTADQRMLAGDATGNLTVVSLVDDGSEPTILQVHNVAISAIAAISDQRVAVASVDGAVHVFTLDAADQIIELTHEAEVTAVVHLSDGQIATAAVDGEVRVWNIDAEPPTSVGIATHQAPVTALVELDDGRIASGAVNGSIHVYPAEENAQAQLVMVDHIGAVRALYPTNGGLLASGGDDASVRIWDPATGELLDILDGHGDLVSALSELPDGRLISTSSDATGRVWDLTLPASQLVEAPHSANISALAPWKTDVFFSGGDDGLVMLGSTSEGVAPREVTRHPSPVVGLGVTQAGAVVSLDAASNLRVLLLGNPGEDNAELYSGQVAPGASALAVRGVEGVATGHTDGTVRFHDLSEETTVVEAHANGVTELLVLDDGRIISAGQGGAIRIIDPESPDAFVSFERHVGAVDALAAMGDGRVASAGEDGIYIWSPDDPTGDSIKLTGHRSPMLTVLPFAGGLLSTGTDGRVRLWDLDNPDIEASTLIDIPGVVNPYLVAAGDRYAAAAGRGYVLFDLN